MNVGVHLLIRRKEWIEETIVEEMNVPFLNQPIHFLRERLADTQDRVGELVKRKTPTMKRVFSY